MMSPSLSGRKPRTRVVATATTLALAVAGVLAGSTAASATTFGGVATHSGQHGPSQSAHALTVKSGQTAVITKTTTLSALTIQSGGALVAPEGYELTLTVNGVETGQRVISTGATATEIVPGSYRGRIVLTVTEENPVEFNGLTYRFRQALFVDGDGVDTGKSVLAAVNGKAGATSAKNVSIRSTGEAFNGIYVVDTDYTLINPRLVLRGNGRSDFAGMGAGIIGSGADTRLVIDGANIDAKGAVRPAIVAADGANVVVKNSTIRTADGVLPDDYQASVDLSYMQSAPWMLGISGNNRSTNVLGENTQATYISSKITSENWGALSVDSGQNMKLSAINSDVANSGEDGYGSYVIGNAQETFLGTRFDVASYATIMTGGSASYGDSTKTAVRSLNDALDLGLTTKEISKLKNRATTIDSDRFGWMWHDNGDVSISGHTKVTTDETTFLDKGQQISIDVDGSDGASIRTGNGVLLQMMENDDPGPDFANGMLNTGVYTEPTNAVVKNDSFDVTAAHDTDAVATFSDMRLNGDLYNGMRGDIGGMGPAQPRNLVLTLDGSSLRGVVSASTTQHSQSTITSADYKLLGVVANKVSPVVNNGVIVSLTGHSSWTVTGTSYLSSLTVEAGSHVSGSVTVDGVAVTPEAGVTYTGNIVVSPR